MKALFLAILAAAPAGAVTMSGRMAAIGASPFGMAAPLPALPSPMFALQPALSLLTLAAPAVVPTAPVPAAAAAKPAFAPGVMALVQYDGDAHFGDYDHNLRELTRLAEEAVAKGAKIIVTPEGSLYGYADKDELWCKPGITEFKGRRCRDVSGVAERVPGGRSAEYWSEFSRRHGVFVLFNVPENDGGVFYNTMGVAGPSGFVARYRKRMLYRTDEAYAAPGTEPMVLKTDYGCFGLMICLDAHPQSPYFQEYKDLEVNALIIAMDWDDDPKGVYAAKLKFREWAGEHRFDIYASDAAPWDGAGKYPADGSERQRHGLPPDAVGVEGVSIHRFQH
jgi:predicted amidohydrolase